MAEMKITQKQGKVLLISRFLQLQIIVLLLLLPGATGLCSVPDEWIKLSPVFPETHQQVKITCYTIKDRIWYHNGNYKTTCNKNICLPSKDQSRRYDYTADEEKTEVTISFLNRTFDSGVWTCYGECKINITLDVYSFPLGLSLHEIGKTELDLALSPVTLECQTDGCTYPMPNITWYYKDVTELISPTSYKETGTQITGKDGVCISPENIYTSLLTLPLHKTWQDNSNKSVTFSCGIDYNSSRKIFSTESQKITFAVGVSQVKLQLENKPLSDTPYLYVTPGISVTLTCVPGLSSPDPTIEWFMGSQLISSGTTQTFTFIPKNGDINNTIFCRAYNINPNGAVESEKAHISLTVHVTEVKLQVNNRSILGQPFLTVISGEILILTCIPGISRPDPTIEWHIGSVMMSSSISHTYAFSPNSDDHGKIIFCRAYTFDTSRAVESNKAKICLKGLPSAVNRFYLNSMTNDQLELHFDPGFNGGHDQSFAIQFMSILVPGSIWINTSINSLQERENRYRLPNGTFSVNVSQPSPGVYLYRMYSWNLKGKSPFSDSILITVSNEEENPDDRQYTTIPVFVGMGAGIAILIITVIALVIVVLRKRSRGSKSEENEVPRYEGVRLDPTGMDNTVTSEYDSIREDDNIYTEMNDNSADSIQINLRLEPGRLIHQSAENDITCNVYDSATSSKTEVYSYEEPLEVRDRRKEKAISRSEVGGMNSPVPRTNAAFNSTDVLMSHKVEVHSYLELQGLD